MKNTNPDNAASLKKALQDVAYCIGRMWLCGHIKEETLEEAQRHLQKCFDILDAEPETPMQADCGEDDLNNYKLRPCPFCPTDKSQPFLQYEYVADGHTVNYAQCRNCGSRGAWYSDDENNWMEKVRNAWNKRSAKPTPTCSEQQIERVARAIKSVPIHVVLYNEKITVYHNDETALEAARIVQQAINQESQGEPDEEDKLWDEAVDETLTKMDCWDVVNEIYAEKQKGNLE